MKLIVTYNARLQSHVLILATEFGSIRLAAIRDTDEFALVRGLLESLISAGKATGTGQVLVDLNEQVTDTVNTIRLTLDEANVQQLA